MEGCRQLAGFPLPTFLYEETASTNDLAKNYAGTGDAVFLAKRQTAGRGRVGHTFLSPAGGLYLTLLLHPKGRAEDAVRLTSFAAVAVAETLRRLTGADARIKWVNDVYIGGKKVAGILTETAAAGAGLAYAAVGIGVNLAVQDFGELSGTVTSVEAETGFAPPPLDVAREIVSRFAAFDFADVSFMKTYRALSLVIGKQVRANDGTSVFDARVLAVEDDGALLLSLPNGEVRRFLSGEVSIKPKTTEKE